jgi:hypothetical protein
MKHFVTLINKYLQPIAYLKYKRLENRNAYLKEVQEYTGIRVKTESDHNNIPLESPLKNGDKIQITYLPSCRNVTKGTPNPYIGMSGTVENSDDKGFALNTGSSILIVGDVEEMAFIRL